MIIFLFGLLFYHGLLVENYINIVIVVLLILLCGPCILQSVVNFVSERLTSFTQIYQEISKAVHPDE